MARLQILELPAVEREDGRDETPYILVIDQASEDIAKTLDPQDEVASYSTVMQRLTALSLAEQIGARAVLVFEETVDIPVNETPVDPDGYSLKFRVEGDFDTFREQVQDEIRKAQADLTRAINRDPASERTDIARDMDRLAKWKLQILDALGMNHSRDWDDIRNTAAGIRKQRDSQGAAIERVRQLHQAVDYRGTAICRECSGYGGQSTDNAPVNHDKCGTLLALAGERPAAHRDITVDNAAEVVAAHDPSRRA